MQSLSEIEILWPWKQYLEQFVGGRTWTDPVILITSSLSCLICMWASHRKMENHLDLFDVGTWAFQEVEFYCRIFCWIKNLLLQSVEDANWSCRMKCDLGKDCSFR